MKIKAINYASLAWVLLVTVCTAYAAPAGGLKLTAPKTVLTGERFRVALSVSPSLPLRSISWSLSRDRRFQVRGKRSFYYRALRAGRYSFRADIRTSGNRGLSKRITVTVLKLAQPNPTPTAVAPADGTPDLGPGASLKGKRVFPEDNPWNQDISGLPVDPNSSTLIASIGAGTSLHPDFGTFWNGGPIGIPYVVVAGTQQRVPVSFYYSDESDPGPYPIPDDAPIEGGQNSSGDRHVIVIERDSWRLYETYDSHRTSAGWTCGSGAIFDLNSNALRPAGWTSADAAGLPIFPGLVRYDEVYEQGEITHALRFTASRTRKAYVYPARHYASSNTSSTLPPMGMRVRLKASVDISTFPPPIRVILTAMKKYGLILADNGSSWFVTGAHDQRWNDELLAELRRIRGSDFEVVQMGEITSG